MYKAAFNQDRSTPPTVRIATPKDCIGEQWAHNFSNGCIAVLTLKRPDTTTTQPRLDVATLLPRMQHNNETYARHASTAWPVLACDAYAAPPGK